MLRAAANVIQCGQAQSVTASLLFAQAPLLGQTRGRRRTLNPPQWVPPVYDKAGISQLDPENRELLNRLTSISTPLRENEAPEIEASKVEMVEPSVRRVGLIATKIGMVPQWTNSGERMLCTMLHVQENNVVSVTSPEDWYKNSIVGKRKAFGREGPMWKVTVGGNDTDPWKCTRAYRSQFSRAGVNVKKTLGSFLVTADAVPPPGTPLDVRHFNIGQFVAATGRSIDWGFQGGMHRWGMRGQPTRRTTKSHRRIGSVGSVGDARIWPGKRMPGHMGYEWVTVSGLQIIRMNLDCQVIYVKGSVPGDIGETLLIKDCRQPQKMPKEMYIPTWTPSLETIAEEGEEKPVSEYNEIHIPKLFRFNQPSIAFTDADGKKAGARDRTKAKIAKVKK